MSNFYWTEPFMIVSPPVFTYCLCSLLRAYDYEEDIRGTPGNNDLKSPWTVYNTNDWDLMKSKWTTLNRNCKKILNQARKHSCLSLASTPPESQEYTLDEWCGQPHNRANWEIDIINHESKHGKESDLELCHPTSINLEALKGHKYEIIHAPSNTAAEGNYLYICKYDDWGKSFNKTYNLVYHFRVHTHEKPFQCKFCSKWFSQKGNLGRHLERHTTRTVEERKVYNWDICSKSYTSIYNLRVG